ncbi:ribosomal protein L1-like protein [Irpex rosettiformis]|uniref:Ribosomal protein L1-like protein n=1 Tax=Irpex rosettiformis TaxID=378272 RepID=A0ACB8UJJ6_9APHY|nr:ribosomal protein L1-like protein [Irpex rosettiformis]
MSFAVLAARCRPSSSSLNSLVPNSTRQFHAATVLSARKKQAAPTKVQRTPQKKQDWYGNEKLTLAEAINVLRAVEVGSPNATYELTIKTAMGKGITVPKGRYTLPREAKSKSEDRILVFAEGQSADDAKAAGADIVGGPELIDGVINGTHKATMFLCTPDLIRTITPRLGRILGPRGLMPSERRGTVTEDIAGYIRRLKGTSEWAGDQQGTIRQPIAKMDFPVEDVENNFRYFLGLVKRATGNVRDTNSQPGKGGPKPVNAITKVVLSTRQGPGIRISDY